MWSLLAVVVALVDAATSRSETLNFKNGHNAIPSLELNALSSVLRRPEPDRFDKFESSGTGISSKDFVGMNGLKYRNAVDEPFPKLPILEEFEGNHFDGSDERIPVLEEEDVDAELGQLSVFLTRLLQEPAGSWEAPLVLVEEPISWDDSPDGSEAIIPTPWKRSRYYRRYPWKRQNSRSQYDYDGSRYLCTPTREDVFQLLVALHDARQGNKSRTVNFCNRRRPAGTVFTNIRFLGRRK